MTGIGMLTLTGNNVAMDSFGPISDNANGIGEMAWHDLNDEETLKARQIMADLDAVGNTTKAITKGVAIGSAVIAACQPLRLVHHRRRPGPDPAGPRTSWTAIRHLRTRRSSSACSSAAPCPGSSARSRSKPSPARPAHRRGSPPAVPHPRLDGRQGQARLRPRCRHFDGGGPEGADPLALISVFMPLIVGLVLQVEALGGFLAGIILSGQLLAVFMANAGGAWDNAKKTIEDEPRDLAANTGKGSERHKAGVVGDTVGDPLKDTAGPALNPMIKVVNLVSLIAAPVIVKYNKMTPGLAVVVGLLLGGPFWFLGKKKGGPPPPLPVLDR